MPKINFMLDGRSVSVEAEDDQPLLYLLRDELGLNNPHFGCGLAQCGACTVHLDGEPLRSCVAMAPMIEGRTVTTLRGLGTPEAPHPLQQAYVDEQVPQCGYCVNGWIMTAAALLKKNPQATDAELRAAARLREAEREDRVPRQQDDEDDGDVPEIAVVVLQHQRKARLAGVAALLRSADSDDTALHRSAATIESHCEPSRVMANISYNALVPIARHHAHDFAHNQQYCHAPAHD